MRMTAVCGAIVLAALIAYGCTETISDPDEASLTQGLTEDAGAAAKADHVTVLFGRPDVGSPFPPAEHDRSFHAKDALQPRTVVIPVGGTVTYLVGPNHYPAIFPPGIGPDDVDTSHIEEEEGCPLPIFEDEEQRLAEGPRTCPGEGVVEWSYTFDAPGRYLVLCQILPHFVEANMYGWVIVK